MDTIFVKNVRERGPAHQGGLCTGKENVCLKENEMDGRLSVCRNSLICNGNNLRSVSHDHSWMMGGRERQVLPMIQQGYQTMFSKNTHTHIKVALSS